MTDVKSFEVVLALAAVLGALRLMYFFRARAMRRLAERWGFQYLGPTAPPQWWFVSSRPLIPAPLPGRFSRLGISQAWNIIEGKSNNTSIFVFDSISAEFRSKPCTYIACQTEESPFPMTTSIERVKKIHGWTVLSGVWFLWFSWLMSVRRLNRNLSYILSD
jgi:hypothetical protein